MLNWNSLFQEYCADVHDARKVGLSSCDWWAPVIFETKNDIISNAKKNIDFIALNVVEFLKRDECNRVRISYASDHVGLVDI